MTEWQKVKLGDICDVRDGTHDSPKQSLEGKFLVTSKHIKGGKIDLSSAYKISLEDFNFVNQRSKVEQWDILISMIGTVGEICLICTPPDFAIKNVGLIKAGNKDLAQYLFYYLKSPISQNDIETRLKGTTQQYLSLSEIRDFPVFLPLLEIQRKIAGILGALDDRIDVLRRENVVLEQMAQAVFQSWFVDFDIVRAKAAGTPESEVCEKYHITPELYALFPSALTPDNLPLGWEKKSLPEIATYLNGLPLQKFPPKNEDEFLPVIKIAELKARSVVGADKASTDIDSKYIIDDGDVIFSWSGSLAVDIWCCGKGALNQHLFKVFSSDYPKWFYYLWTKSYLFQFQQIAAGKATTMGHIQRAHLEEAKANVPSEKILEVTDKIISPLIEKIIENSKQIRALSATRDALLPKLMNGEIEV